MLRCVGPINLPEALHPEGGGGLKKTFQALDKRTGFGDNCKLYVHDEA